MYDLSSNALTVVIDRQPDRRPTRASLAAVADEVEVQRALTAIRYDHALTDSPLVDSDAVREILLRESVAPTARGRAWAFGLLVDEIVTERISAARRAAGVAPREGADSAANVAADFGAASPELELWSALYYRYLDPARMQAGELASRAGMPRRTLGRRLAVARRQLLSALAARDRDACRRIGERSETPVPTSLEATTAQQPSAGSGEDDTLLASILGSGGIRAWRCGAELDRLAEQRPTDLEAYRLSRVAAWSRPAYRVDARFVDLTLLIDRGEEASERWTAKTETYYDLGTALDAVESPAVVLLGPPGSGKSTLLRRLELDTAVAGLREETDAVPFLVSLSRYWVDREGPDEPRAWLARLWDRRYPDLPRLDDLLHHGRLVLLLDGLNEMPHAGIADFRSRVLAWKRFLRETVSDHPGIRLVFASRSLDYGAPLSSPEQRVPHVRVESMNDAQVRAFLHRYGPDEADAIWATLQGTADLELVRSPYLLSLLVEQMAAAIHAPIARAALFTGFIRRALRREIERDNPLFQPGPLLDERDYRRVVSGRRWSSHWSLPERGALVPGLARLAFGIQDLFTKGRASQGCVPLDTALALINDDAAEVVLRAGEALAVLDESMGGDEVSFVHPLLQDYFAARHLAAVHGVHGSRRQLSVGWVVPDVRVQHA